MAIITQSEAAQLKGVTPQAIQNAMRRGRLIARPDGRIDTRRRENAVYLAIDKGTKIPDKAGRAKSAKEAVAVVRERPGRPSVSPEQLARLGVRIEKGEKRKKKESALDAAKIREEIEKLRIANGKSRGTLTPTIIAVHTMADLGTTISTHFLQLPRRTAERAIAMAKAGSTARELETFISNEVGRAIAQFKEQAIKRFEALISDLDDAEDEDEDEEPESGEDE